MLAASPTRTSLLVLVLAACSTSGASGGSGVAGNAGRSGAAGSAGDPDGTAACFELTCLGGHTLIYQPDREWQRPPPTSLTSSDNLAEADYTPLSNAPSIQVQFSSDSEQVELQPAEAGEVVAGTRLQTLESRVWYDLDLFAGGRFVARQNAMSLQGEYTVYGSGVLIASSTRGELRQQPR